ncbi:hypothetical protein CW354_09670 [Marinicaulis flavus]|uniref:Uncharacterized protein n=1 Tax=Hyphococcus luteus TaxID=2058213 RepID=A0A2S7K7R1_9PROT|nr:hypothetical protein CW354_09670 [Marinicaulis flavus]
MFRLQAILLSGAAFWAAAAPTAAATPADPKYYGSLYPEDMVEPVNEEVSRQAPVRRRDADQSLVKALGAAGYLVSTRYAPADFAAAIKRAIGRQPAYHAQASNLDEASALRRQARSSLYPQLSAQFRGDYAVSRSFDANTNNVVESLRPREQFTAGVSASQLIFDGGAAINRIRSARATSAEYKNALSTQINDLAMAVLTAYYDVAAHQALTAFSKSFISRQEKILEDVKERERLGAGSKADITRARARLAAARARLAEIRESMRLAEIRYEEFFGEAPEQLRRPAIAEPALSNRNESVAEALESNPEVAAAEARADARKADFKAARAARLPEVRLSVDAVKYDVFQTGDDFDVRAGVTVNYDIFGGGARAADIAIARSRAKRERFNEEQKRQDVAREAAMAFERVRGADERLAALGEALVAHDITRELVLERYKYSRGDLIDVLQAESDYFEAGVDYVIALSSSDMAGYALMEQTGDLIGLFSPQTEYGDERLGAAQ